MQSKLTHGYRTFLYDHDNGFDDLDSIHGTVGTAINATMHVTVADPGKGPVLLYWYDLDAERDMARIRGRVVFDSLAISDDFDITGCFKLTPGAGGGPKWHGDYKTAGAFRVEPVPGQVVGPAVPSTGGQDAAGTYKYFPMWVGPDDSLRYTTVTVTETGDPPLKASGPGGIGMRAANALVWRKAPGTQWSSPAPQDREMLEEHRRVPRVPPPKP